ncbi:MAG: N-acetylmuramoyl-L-alanine amidase [bacterium]
MLFFISLFFLFICSYTVSARLEKIIYIDPGHGGYDGGAFVDGVKEADINLAISLELKSILEDNGYKVLLTRDGDYDLSTDDNHKKRTDIQERVKLIENSEALFYISIHQNTYTNAIYSGAQCFYNKYNGLSQLLAHNIQESIFKSLNNTTRVAKSIDGIYLIDNVEKPGVLVECGFMSNVEEFNLLKDSDYQNQFAKSIYYGLLSYLLLC